MQELDRMSLQKFMNAQQKCSVFGINTFKQNSRISLRYLKFHLFTNDSKENFSNSFTQDQFSSKTSSIDFQNSENFNHTFTQRKPNEQNSAKSSLNFWWSQKNFQPF